MKRRLLLLIALLCTGPAPAEVVIEAPDAPGGLLDDLRARLSLAAEPCESSAWRVRRLFARAEEDLQPALNAFGYYRARITKRLDQSGECWEAELDIALGERARVRSRSVVVLGDAAGDSRLREVLAGLPLPEGAPLNHGEYEAIKTRLREFAAERGYMDFELTRQQLRIYPEQAAVEIDIEAQSGPRYRFGELRFNEQELDDDLVRRLARTRAGDPYHARRLAALDRRLSDSGYFSRVEVRPRRDEAVDLAVPVDIVLEPASRHAWRAGIGYATDTGPRMNLEYQNRYLNRRGHRFESELRLSPVESGLNASYLIPGGDPHRENYSFGVSLLHEDNDSAESDSITVYGRQTVRVGDWTQIRFLELLHEQSTIGDQKSRQTLLMPGIHGDRLEADNILRTRRGYRLSYEVRVAHEGLLSTTTLLQLKGSAKGIHRFGDAGRITARVDGGTTLGDSIGDLPASLRFFAGGDNSVRGYGYKSLGPVDNAGEPEGGRHLLVGSVEYEHPVAGEDWWAAAFVDAGNAFETEQIDVKVGYGVGLRWYSPVGRLRLDVAFPDDTTHDEWRLHFGLGADL